MICLSNNIIFVETMITKRYGYT